MNKTSKSKKSIYTAVTAITLTMLNGIFGLVVTRLVIAVYGSDFNGLNSTVSQFISMLLIVEGGFTLATNIALFKPLASGDISAINGIMAATKKTFNKIGATFFILGIVFSFGYSLLLKTSLPLEIAVLTFLMTIVSTSFNLMYAAKYRILLQTEQREYVLNIIQISTIILTQAMIIAVVFTHGNMLLIRFATMTGSIINGLLVSLACRKTYKFINLKVKPDFESIKGTKDVFAQKITGMIYTTVPIVFISATSGTVIASVYFVYNSVFFLLKSIIYSIINAPAMGLGNLIAEKEESYVYKVFSQYEFIVNFVALSLLSTTAVLIIPFIGIYTRGISDVQYSNQGIAIMFLCICFFEIIHIPSGNMINMSGRFAIGKKIQTIASIFLVVLMVAGNLIFGIYGILGAVALTAVLLAIMEIGYMHNVYFKKTLAGYLRILMPTIILSGVLAWVELAILPELDGYVDFVIAGAIIFPTNCLLLLLGNILINKNITLDVISRVSIIIKKRPAK